MTAKPSDSLRSLLRSGQKEIQIPAGVNLHTDLKPGEMFEVDGFHIYGDGTLSAGPDYPNLSNGWDLHKHSPLLRLKSGECLIEGITWKPPLIDLDFHMPLFAPDKNGAPSFPLVWVDAGTKTTLRQVKQPDINRGNLIITGDDSASPGTTGTVIVEDCNLCDRFSIIGVFGSWDVFAKRNVFRNSYNGTGIAIYKHAQGLLLAKDCILLDQTRCGLRAEGKNSRGSGSARIIGNKIHSTDMCLKFDSEGVWQVYHNDFHGEEAIRQNVRAATSANLFADGNLFACKTAITVVREGLDSMGPVDFTAWFSNNLMAGITSINQMTDANEGCTLYHDNWNGWTGEDDKAQLYDAGAGKIDIRGGAYFLKKLHSFLNSDGHIEARDMLLTGYCRAGIVFDAHEIHPEFVWEPRLTDVQGRGEYYDPSKVTPVVPIG